MSNKVTYRQQHTRCGKERCRKCNEGTGHGPYWYAYWSEAGRTVSKYVGIDLPANVVRDRHLTRNSEHSFAVEQVTGHPPLPSLLKDAALTINGAVETGQELPLQLPSQVLRIYVLGQFRVDRLHGNVWSPVVNRTWHRRRARSLLGCLLCSASRRQSREQLMEALWPNLDRETAANRLNGAVHELRQILEPELARPAASCMLRLEHDVLVLADRTALWVDADAFESLLNEANQASLANDYTMAAPGAHLKQTEEVERLLENALALYEGDYLLEELYSEWAAPRREVLRRGWIGLLLKLSELREARGAYSRAMEPLNRLLASDPTDETAVQRLMLLLTQLDRRGEALDIYRRLATRLERNFESEPLPETHELYEKLRQGQISKMVHSQNLSAHSEKTINTATQRTAAPSPGSNHFGRSYQSPLIGRVHELETIREVLHSIEGTAQKPLPDHDGNSATNSNVQVTHAKQTRVLLLMGEAGIGKTRLAEEVSHEANARGWAVAWTRAYEQEGAVPYRSWIELLRTLLQNIPATDLISSVGRKASDDTSKTVQDITTALERLSTLLPELRDILPTHGKAHPQLSPEQERLHLWEATLRLLSLFSKTSPLLLILDDLHWTDDSSRELLAYLTRHIQEQRILILGTCLDVELSPNHVLRTLIADLRREQAIVTVAVQPLTQAQIGSLVAHLPLHIVQSIQKQALGNPFFAEELARVSLAQTPAEASVQTPPPQTPHPHTSPVEHHEQETRKKLKSSRGLPDGIAAVLERRLGRLSNECQLLLGKAAVLGGSFEFGQLLSMATEQHEDAIVDLLEEALRAGLLKEEGTGARITYHFWHPLVVSHLYDRLSAARCAQLHRRAANALLNTHAGHEGDVSAAITYHLGKSGGYF